MPLVTYSALRLGLLAACFLAGYAAGLRTWLLLAVAVFVAWALSYVLLARPRDAAAQYLARRAERRRAAGRRYPGGSDDDAALEDAWDERARVEGAVPQPDLRPDRQPDLQPDLQPDTARPRPNSTP